MRIAVIQGVASEPDSVASSRARALERGVDWVVAPLGDGEVLHDVPHAAGRVVALHGDSCFDPAVLGRLYADPPDALIMTPMSESDLQAEASLEFALALSESVAPLVIITENVGSEPGDPGHGGSAVVKLGEVLAEAMDDDESLVVDLDLPLGAPEPRDPLPEPAPILAQRLASHGGRRLAVSYPADLSDGRHRL